MFSNYQKLDVFTKVVKRTQNTRGAVISNPVVNPARPTLDQDNQAITSITLTDFLKCG